jgi:hypothetical protein
LPSPIGTHGLFHQILIPYDLRTADSIEPTIPELPARSLNPLGCPSSKDLKIGFLSCKVASPAINKLLVLLVTNKGPRKSVL